MPAARRAAATPERGHGPGGAALPRRAERLHRAVAGGAPGGGQYPQNAV